MHHVELSPMLQGLVVLLLALTVLQVVRMTRWPGRLVLLSVVLACAVTNPGRERHLAAIRRTTADAGAQQLDARVAYHDFLVFSAASVRGRLASVGWLDRVVVG